MPTMIRRWKGIWRYQEREGRQKKDQDEKGHFFIIRNAISPAQKA